MMTAESPRQVTKRHHVIPQFYLRGFAAGDKISTVALPGVKRFEQVVRKAASVTNFYALDGHDDGIDAFEKSLAYIEGEAARVFDVILSGVWPLAPEDRQTLAYFIALQAVRVPQQRRNMEFIVAQGARLEIGFGGRASVKSWFKRNRGLDLTDEEAEDAWREATRPEGPPVTVTPLAHIVQMMSLSDKLLMYMSGRPWVLVEFDQRSLITCDSPVGLVRHADDDQPWLGVGFGNAWGITYPVTRKIGILMSDPTPVMERVSVDRVREGMLDSRQFGTTALEKMFNDHTVRSSSEWLFHHPEDGKFVPKQLPSPSPTSLTIGGDPHDFSGEPLFRRDPPK